MRRFNAPLWSGLLLTLIAIFSYIYLFTRWPITRDVPWTAFVLFALALVLLVAGFRRAQRKIAPSIVTAISIALMVLFTVGVTIGTRTPPSSGAPAVGQKAPQFPALAQALATPGTNGVLLVFYRGYW